MRAAPTADADGSAAAGSAAPTAGRASRVAGSAVPRFLLRAGGERLQRLRAVVLERPTRDRVRRAGGQSQGEPQIMQGEEPEPEELLLVHEVPDEGARELRARGTPASLLERTRVACEAGVAHVQASPCSQRG